MRRRVFSCHMGATHVCRTSGKRPGWRSVGRRIANCHLRAIVSTGRAKERAKRNVCIVHTSSRDPATCVRVTPQARERETILNKLQQENERVRTYTTHRAASATLQAAYLPPPTPIAVLIYGPFAPIAPYGVPGGSGAGSVAANAGVLMEPRPIAATPT